MNIMNANLGRAAGRRGAPRRASRGRSSLSRKLSSEGGITPLHPNCLLGGDVLASVLSVIREPCTPAE
jgi:hypothetical protein